MIKRLCIWILLLALLLPGAAWAVSDSAVSMILYEPRTGTVLKERNADEQRLIASTTKIMTALLVSERCRLSQVVEITEDMCGAEGSSMYLTPGDAYTVEDLLYGLMLASANDAAEALAIHAAGSIETFAAWMNERAAAIGMTNTHFTNPNGLDDPAGQHYSSARDMALLTADAMKNPTFCKFFAAESHEIHGTVFPNHNRLLQSYPGCIGGKTGYTMAAGRTLVSVAERDGLRLICVTLTDPNDWVDHAALFDEGFAGYQFLTFPAAGWRELPVISGTAASVQLKCAEPCVLTRRSADLQVHVSLPRFVFAPVQRGDVLGTLNVTLQGKVLVKTDILAAADVPVDETQRLTRWERFTSLSGRYAAALSDDVFFA